MVPGYELVRELARGGMGVVHEAWSVALGRPVALKLIRPDALGDAEALARLEREIAAQTRLSHPSVVPVLATGNSPLGPWVAMELVVGETLAARLRREGPPPPARTAAWMADLAGAIAHAHAQGVLHRDLKPANVMFGADHVPRIIDFGLAYMLHESTRLTASGTVLGTPAYMAPEQVQGSRRADERSDVYGLGAILYQLLCGRPPREGSSALAILQAVLTRDAVPPSRHHAGVDPELERICLRCLARDPAARFDSAAALQAALLAWRPATSQPRWRSALLLVPLLLCAGLALWLALSPRVTAPLPAVSPDALRLALALAPTCANLTSAARLALAEGLGPASDLEARIPEAKPRARLLLALHLERATREVDFLFEPSPALDRLARELDPDWSRLGKGYAAIGRRDLTAARDALEALPGEAALGPWREVLRGNMVAEGPERYASFERALELDPGCWPGLILLSAREPRAGLALIEAWRGERVLSMRVIQAYLHERVGEKEESLELARELVQLRPAPPRALHLLVQLRMAEGETGALAPLLEQLLARDDVPSRLRFLAHFDLARIREMLGEWELASEHFREASRSPERELAGAALLGWGQIQLELGRSLDRAALEGIGGLGVADVPKILTRLSPLAQALRAAEPDTDDPTRLRERVRACRAANDLRGALAALDRLLARDPVDEAALGERAVLRRQRGHHPGCLADLERLARIRELRPEELHLRAMSLGSMGRHSQAVAIFRELLALAPSSQPYQLGLAAQLIGAEERVEALRVLHALFALPHLSETDRGWAHLMRSVALRHQGDLVGALRELDAIPPGALGQDGLLGAKERERMARFLRRRIR